MNTLLQEPRITRSHGNAYSQGPAQRRVLFISYQFPPVGGAGVQRPVKFIKYLRQFGWDATVLTVANPSVPVFDESLLRDLPDDLTIAKARTFEPGYAFKQQLAGQQSSDAAGPAKPKGGPVKFLKSILRSCAGVALQPDPQILWLPAALRAGTKLLRKIPHDAIVATAPPYTSLLLGGLLKRRTGLPLLVDYRDEWDLSSRYLENASRNRWAEFVQERMQSWVLRQADTVVATTEASISRLRERMAQAGSHAATACIYNGFDTDDFAQDTGMNFGDSRSTKLRIVYTGTLWNLTSVEPLVAAVEQLNQTAPELAALVEFVAVGRKTPEQRQLLQRLEQTRATLLDIPYCEHSKVLELLTSADVQCLLLSDVPGAERVVSAKMFEYFATGRPILAISPTGETSSILSRFESYRHFVPTDVSGIAAWLADRVRKFQSGDRFVAESPAGIDEFSRERLTSQLAGLLDQLVQTRKERG